MAHITIETVPGVVVVRAGGAVLGETRGALALREGSYPPVLYVPRADIAMAFLDRSARASTCPHKGAASYFHISTPAGRIEDAAWSYETPHPEVAAIAGHLAFYPDKAEVERL